MRSIITGLVVCAAACGVVWFAPVRPAPDRVRPAIQVAAGPSEENQAYLRRAAAKEEVVERLVAGRLRLGEAVEEFLALNRAWPAVPDHWYETLPGRSIPERVARSIVSMVELRLAGDPGREEVLGRLTCELSEVVATADRPTAVAAAIAN